MWQLNSANLKARLGVLSKSSPKKMCFQMVDIESKSHVPRLGSKSWHSATFSCCPFFKLLVRHTFFLLPSKKNFGSKIGSKKHVQSKGRGFKLIAAADQVRAGRPTRGSRPRPTRFTGVVGCDYHETFNRPISQCATTLLLSTGL